MNGDKMITNGAEHQKGDEESNNTGLGKNREQSLGAERGQQHTVRNKLKEDFQII